MSLRRILECLVVAMLVAGLVFLARAWACGPLFPQQLLTEGDRAVLAPPVADFRLELERIKLPVVSPFRAIPPVKDLRYQESWNYSQQTAEADLSDLQAALEKTDLPEKQREALVAQYQAFRGVMRVYGPVDERPPREFVDYLRGAIPYYQGNMSEARAAWEAMLDLPASQRRYRSTWAAFMLGKSWLRTDPEQAVVWFERVRDLAQQGFIDSLGLAAASLGWQARAELDRKRYSQAIELYLAQFATGDPTALLSLIQAVERVFAAGSEALQQGAMNPVAQRVVTAYIIAQGSRYLDLYEYVPTPLPTRPVNAWLDAVKAAAVTDMEGAERLAWAAYQAGEMETARRWLDRARPEEAMTLWLRAKLLLYDGRIDKAASLLARVARLFPPSERRRDLTRLLYEDPSWGEEAEYLGKKISPSHRALGELGVVHLARRAYTEALDALLRAGFWMDAAYVAERVLAPGELIAYVDRHWPQGMPLERAQPVGEQKGSAAKPPGEPGSPTPEDSPGNGPKGPSEDLIFRSGWTHDPEQWLAPDRPAANIRYLLARRLARMGRWKEARGYYPPSLQPRLDAYGEAIQKGRDRHLSANKRAKALWKAAQIARYEGMELLGTEIEPDWRIFDGNFGSENLEFEPVSSARSGRTRFEYATPYPAKIVQASPDERDRLRRHVHPQKRFHYRYTAADLAWEAAALMLDPSEATARVLYIAGSWLKTHDPKAAD